MLTTAGAVGRMVVFAMRHVGTDRTRGGFGVHVDSETCPAGSPSRRAAHAEASEFTAMRKRVLPAARPDVPHGEDDHAAYGGS